MKDYKPSAPFAVPMKVMIPTESMSYGVAAKDFPPPKDWPEIFGSFRTFGGSERMVDGIYQTVDTAVIDTWYRPDIKADCKIYLTETGEIYDIVADPEDIGMRHQWMQLKVRKSGGKP